MTRVSLSLFLALCAPAAFACSFAQPIPVEFDAAQAKTGERAPAAPMVSVESIRRGNANDPFDSCGDTGVVVLSVPATRKTKGLAYTFEVISGTADDVIFDPSPSFGFKSDGKYLFVFPWVDGADNAQEPLNLVVRVTAYRRSGLKGGSTDVAITDRGR
ncbi:MAG: hypothetical protein E6Q88_08380 [Lysobacteraceae bacterium]|nr:MAG: hypothetical protein E6Q88_08380 [Xanthomonadaceae bacterium]